MREREKKYPTRQSQASGPESLPLLWNQKHLLIASKRQRGSVSLSAAVIPHSDEHLKCQDPFQQLCTSNQALSSVTVILQPPQLSPHDSSPCVSGDKACTGTHNTTSPVFGRTQLKGPGRQGRDGATAGVGMSQARSLHGNVCWIESLGVFRGCELKVYLELEGGSCQLSEKEIPSVTFRQQRIAFWRWAFQLITVS